MLLDENSQGKELLETLKSWVQKTLEKDPSSEHQELLQTMQQQLKTLPLEHEKSLIKNMTRAKEEPYKLLYSIGALFRFQYFGGFDFDGTLDSLLDLTRKQADTVNVLFCVEAPLDTTSLVGSKTDTTLKNGEFLCWIPDNEKTITVGKVFSLSDIDFGCIFEIKHESRTISVFVCHLSSSSEDAQTKQIDMMIKNNEIMGCHYIMGDFNTKVNHYTFPNFQVLSRPSWEITKTRYSDNMFTNHQYAKGGEDTKQDYMYILGKIMGNFPTFAAG